MPLRGSGGGGVIGTGYWCVCWCCSGEVDGDGMVLLDGADMEEAGREFLPDESQSTSESGRRTDRWGEERFGEVDEWRL